jgi:hypothetical protein
MFEKFKEIIRQDIEEFIATGRLSKAVELSAKTGQHFNHNEYPLYFTGKLDAKIVLVHLNPKQKNNYADVYKGALSLESFEDYFDYHQNFGMYKYGKATSRTHKSPFDHKQIRFLKQFGVINFVEVETKEDVYTNLERVVDDKLQMELIPYGSDKFSSKGFPPEILLPHIERVLDVIAACPRDYVIFCGGVFEELFRSSVTDIHEFKLTKNSGEPARNKARFANLRFEYNGRTILAGLAHTFAGLTLSLVNKPRSADDATRPAGKC